MIAGGFIRSCVANETINDIDCFVPSVEVAREIAIELAEGDNRRIYETDNAFTIKGYKIAIQLVHRWTFTTPESAIESFDFTIAKGAFWWEPNNDAGIGCGSWRSICDSRFYADLAGKRLIYCSPVRNEDAGGSLLRVLKFYQRGYRIPLDSMGAVISRLVMGLRLTDVTRAGDWSEFSESKVAKVITGLLREVDPNIDPDHIAHLPSEEKPEEQEGV